MSQPKKKGLFASIPPRTRVALALTVIAILVVFAFFAPKEPDPTFTGDTEPVTVTVSHPVTTVTVNRGVDYDNVHIMVTQVAEAAAFSDDNKPGGVYTVRVELQAQSSRSQAPIGIDYASLARLVLAGGQVITPKLVSIAPLVLPHSMQDGYIDFPVASQVDLSLLKLRMGSATMVAFGG